jgi:hypothetical protein
MKVGDLVSCLNSEAPDGHDYGIILKIEQSHAVGSEWIYWLEVLWDDGQEQGIASDDVEIIQTGQ